MNLDRLKKFHKNIENFSTGSRIHSRICMWTQNHGSGSDLASILIEFIWFFQNLINFRRTKNIFILFGFEIFWMFWKAMSLNRSFLGFMMRGDMIYPSPQRKREASFGKNPDWPPDLMCTTPPYIGWFKNDELLFALEAAPTAPPCSAALVPQLVSFRSID